MSNKRISLLFSLFMLLCISITLSYAKTSNGGVENPLNNIPTDIRQQIERLSSEDPRQRGEAAQALAERGEIASPATPFLIPLLGDTRHILWQEENRIIASSSVDKETLKAIVSIGKPAVESLVGALKDENIDIRRNAAEALGEIGDSRAVRPLIASLTDADSNVRKNAADALGEIGDTRAIDSLISSLEDKKTKVKNSAEEALRKIFENMKADQNLDQLLSLLKHKGAFVRRIAINTIKESKDSRAIEPLILSLKDGDSDIRGIAGEALSEIGAPAVEPLVRILKKDDKDIQSKITVAEILGDIKDKRAVEPLIDTLEYKGEGTVQELTVLHVEAARALGKIGDARAVEPLIQALAVEDIRVRESAAGALRQIGEPAVEPLLSSLKSKTMSVKINAVKILGDFKDKRAAGPLIEEIIFDDFDEKSWVFRAAFRTEAAKALGKIKDPRAIDVLKRLRNDDVFSVRETAEWALREIIGKESEKEEKSWWEKIF